MDIIDLKEKIANEDISDYEVIVLVNGLPYPIYRVKPEPGTRTVYLMTHSHSR